MKLSAVAGRVSVPRVSTLAVLVALASPSALAQTGWYIGASAGESRADMDADRIVADLQTLGYDTLQIPLDDKALAGKVFAGYSVTPNFALEVSYFDLGSFDYSARVLPTAVQGGEASVRGFGVDLVGTLPMGDRLSAFAKVGVNNARIGEVFNGTGPVGFSDASDWRTQAKYGAGLQYAVNDAFSVRAELERYHIDTNRITRDEVDTLTLGVVYRFGARPAPAVVQAPAPQPAPAPAPPPQPVRITLEASTLFDFDRAELRAEGRRELDALVADMDDIEYDIVVVTGHTDRIGSRDYNLALSERRANTVRDYLVQAGIPAANITARGVNSDQPVTTPQQCQGPVSDALKACLQPDRRVEVEINGTREPE